MSRDHRGHTAGSQDCREGLRPNIIGVEGAYRQSTRVLSLIMVAVGAGLIAVTLVNGGGPLSTGVLFGVLLAALGAGRFYLARGSSSS